jgi:hypothetical protein
LSVKTKSRPFGPGFAYFDLILILTSDQGIPGRLFKVKAEKEKEKIIHSGKRLHIYLFIGSKVETDSE